MSEKKEYLQFKFKVDEASDDGSTGYIKGFASTFGNVDLGLDVIEKGAFKKTIKDKGGVFPMLLDHDPGQPAGFQKVEEADKGLMFDAELKLHDPRVKQRYELAKLSLKYQSPMGVSIGYRAVKYAFEKPSSDPSAQTIRKLQEVALYETSLVTFPMNERATVTGAKSRELAALFALIQDEGYDLDKLKKALAAFSKEERQAAEPETDPALFQSVDMAIQRIRALT